MVWTRAARTSCARFRGNPALLKKRAQGKPLLWKKPLRGFVEAGYLLCARSALALRGRSRTSCPPRHWDLLSGGFADIGTSVSGILFSFFASPRLPLLRAQGKSLVWKKPLRGLGPLSCCGSLRHAPALGRPSVDKRAQTRTSCPRFSHPPGSRCLGPRVNRWNGRNRFAV